MFKALKKNAWIISTLSPVLLILTLVMVIPMIYAIWLSFHIKGPFTLTAIFTGIENYRTIFTSPEFYRVLWRSIYYTGGSVILQVAMGLAIALLLVRTFRGQLFARTIVILPYLIPTAVVGLIFSWLFSTQYGIVNQILQQIGLVHFPVNFFGSPDFSMLSVIIAGSWKFGMFVSLLFLARLQGIPQVLYEAAKVSGAGPLRCFLDITVPHLKSTVLLVVLLRGIWMFNKFDLIWILTKGGPVNATETLPIYAYRVAFNQYSFGLASAVSVTMFLIMFVGAILYFTLFNPSQEVEVE